MNKQRAADILSQQYGTKVRVGLHRWIEDVRDEKTGRLVDQIVHDEGEKFTRDDGGVVDAADLAAALEAAGPNPQREKARDIFAEMDALKARIAELEGKR